MAANHSLQSSDHTQESALQGLLDYCNEQSIYISPSIAARPYPDRGLGVYTLKPIKKGDKLVHVPLKAMLTTRSIPESFLSKTVLKKFSVHCALAAFLAFGKDKDLAKYQRWMATWPKLEEFIETLPVFWKEDFRKLSLNESNFHESSGTEVVNGIGPDSQKRATKRRKTLSKAENTLPPSTEYIQRSQFSRSPGLDDIWLTLSSSSSPHSPSDHINQQAAKLRTCIAMIAKHLPHLNIRSPSSHSLYLRFLYAWSCVNTRCFYYLHPGQSPPSDANEAMALCPFQDLFNHESNSKGVTAIFDRKGFYVTSDKDYDTGNELFFRYGRHTNDMLWMEYGFFGDEVGKEAGGNKDDEVRIDRIVFDTHEFNEQRLKMLDAAGYKGNYTLRSDGVCFRTITTSYLGILEDEQWARMASGGFDPETNTIYTRQKLEAKRKIIDWVTQLSREAEQNLAVLEQLGSEKVLIDAFVSNTSLTEGQQHDDVKVRLAHQRRAMCNRRWRQISRMCSLVVRNLEEQYPEALMIKGKNGTTKEGLKQMK